MAYSFIRPKPKSIFKRYTKIWFVYSILAVVCICGFAKVLEKQIIAKINEQTHIEENIQNIKLKTIVIKDYIVYKFLLEAPLRAIFTQVRVEFYPLVSGWFNFVAVSKANPTLKPLKNDKKEQSDE